LTDRVRFRGGLIGGVFAAASFAAAFLLFLIEPMFAKIALPLLGGSSDVWTVCVLFYQCSLLAAYVYAHLLQRLRRVRDQAIVHGVLTLLAIGSLPLSLRGAGHPPAGSAVVLWLLGVLTATIGLPFFVLSAMSPMFQAWFSAALPGRNPYGLYAASNTGSLAALALYPLVLDPLYGIRAQTLGWTAGYCVFAVGLLACAVLARNGRLPDPLPQTRESAPRRELSWVVLAFIPSSLMLSVTTYLSSTVAPLPLLWTVPLGLYLITFIIVFGSDPARIVVAANRILPIILVPLVFLLCLRATIPWLVITLLLHLAVFTLIALICHGRLAADRPGPGDLTAFYACLALGGALGGIFSGLIAPFIFRDLYEYPLVLGLACFALAPRGPQFPWQTPRSWLPPVVFVAIVSVALIISQDSSQWSALGTRIVLAIGAVGCFVFAERPSRYGIAVVGLLSVAAFGTNPLHAIDVERNLYGTKMVVLVGDRWHALAHGSTVHGAQRLVDPYELVPETYYTRSGPLGDVFTELDTDATPIAVVGLGAGSIACYQRAGRRWDFYEIDPQIVEIARDPRLFTYLEKCSPNARVIVGDGRLMLARAATQSYGTIILDAYSSDAIPTHLLTREAMELYRTRLEPHGRLLFHLSNRYFDFAPVVAALAKDAGMIALMRFDAIVTPADREIAKSPSVWMAVASTRDDLRSLGRDPRWHAVAPGRLWTDDYSSVITVLRRSPL